MYCVTALNHYSSRYYADCPAVEPSEGWFDDQLASVSNVNFQGHVIGPVAESSWCVQLRVCLFEVVVNSAVLMGVFSLSCLL